MVNLQEYKLQVLQHRNMCSIETLQPRQRCTSNDFVLCTRSLQPGFLQYRELLSGKMIRLICKRLICNVQVWQHTCGSICNIETLQLAQNHCWLQIPMMIMMMIMMTIISILMIMMMTILLLIIMLMIR